MNEPNLTAKQTKDVEKLFEMGAHLGHKKNHLHPKARKFVYRIVNGVSIIDLTQTVARLDEAKTMMTKFAKDGKVLLVVVTKKVANHETAEICQKNDIPHITAKWLPGLLTNFETIMKNVKKLQTYKDDQTSGEWDKYVKHERIAMTKDMVKLEKLYGGLLNLKKKPDVMFVVDIKKEKNAVTEAKKNNLPIIAIVDTNSNPEQVDCPILLNDDSPMVVQSVIHDLLDAYISGKTEEQPKA